MQAVKTFLVNKVKKSKPSNVLLPEWQVEYCSDSIVAEEPLEIWLKQQSSSSSKPERLMTTMRSPGDDINLVAGWLHTSGLVGQASCVQSISHTGSEHLRQGTSNQILVTMMPNERVDTTQQNRLEYASSSCGVCGQQSIESLLEKLPNSSKQLKAILPFTAIYPLAQALLEKQVVFEKTGGNHGAGLFEIRSKAPWELIDVREDVGRHNALDKLIGANFELLLGDNEDDFAADPAPDYGIVLSGRVSFDLVQKAAMANIRLIIAMGAPSSLAIELANECDICMVGFVKETSFNLYSAEETIDMQPASVGIRQEL